MRSIISKVILAVGLTSSVPAMASGRQVYLGGAYDLPHCQDLAGQENFGLATFGGYINGVYYWNACFGSLPRPRPIHNSRHTYLGGALSVAHCQILAGNAGYGLATFGGYINGIYYWNGCFGSY